MEKVHLIEIQKGKINGGAMERNDLLYDLCAVLSTFFYRPAFSPREMESLPELNR